MTDLTQSYGRKAATKTLLCSLLEPFLSAVLELRHSPPEEVADYIGRLAEDTYTVRLAEAVVVPEEMDSTVWTSSAEQACRQGLDFDTALTQCAAKCRADASAARDARLKVIPARDAHRSELRTLDDEWWTRVQDPSYAASWRLTRQLRIQRAVAVVPLVLDVGIIFAGAVKASGLTAKHASLLTATDWTNFGIHLGVNSIVLMVAAVGMHKLRTTEWSPRIQKAARVAMGVGAIGVGGLLAAGRVASGLDPSLGATIMTIFVPVSAVAAAWVFDQAWAMGNHTKARRNAERNQEEAYDARRSRLTDEITRADARVNDLELMEARPAELASAFEGAVHVMGAVAERLRRRIDLEKGKALTAHSALQRLTPAERDAIVDEVITYRRSDGAPSTLLPAAK